MCVVPFYFLPHQDSEPVPKSQEPSVFPHVSTKALMCFMDFSKKKLNYARHLIGFLGIFTRIPRTRRIKTFITKTRTFKNHGLDFSNYSILFHAHEVTTRTSAWTRC